MVGGNVLVIRNKGFVENASWLRMSCQESALLGACLKKFLGEC